MRINYVLDCADPDALAGFWAAALGFERGPFDDEGHWTTVLADPEGNEFCVIVSPEDQ
jgi:hypothetical protein